MQIDKEKLQKLLSLNDDELKKQVTDAVNSSNFDKKDKENLDKAVKSMKDLKKNLGNIDENTLKQAINAIGIDKIEEIKKTLKK